ncbi:uncharacterized protein LOC135840818 isoform X5 [Planococcus citri]|uniref:uncharacterized protein LOC135840818 isoform X5 n=1 Tax=Planococcus citri TaxID=170843 RepID=UPI0031F733E0
MADVTSNVYDLLFPSPADLKEIAAISIAVQLWRQEINTHRMRNTLSELDLDQDILSSTSMPRIPSSILSDIEKYVKRFGMSIQAWLKFHKRLFKNEIFNDFIDFVGDFDGTIHYVRTAKRIVRCDRVDDVLKFNIACRYCFEDDISRIFPLVSDYAKTLSISQYRYNLPFYWVCRLKNQFYKMPGPNNYGQPFEEKILDHRSSLSNSNNPDLAWSGVEYFWNLLNANSRRQIALPLHYYAGNFTRILCRYLLQTFDEVMLDRFIKGKACHVLTESLHAPLFRSDSRRLYIMATWTFLKNKMDSSTFVLIVERIIEILCPRPHATKESDKSVYGELWTTAPDHLKQHAIQTVFRENSLFKIEHRPELVDERIENDADLFAFLYAVLSDTSAEDRRIFWEMHWSNLIHLLLTKSLDQLMCLCFGNDENEIIKFKLDSLSKLKNIKNLCLGLLSKRYFEELNDFLNLCCPKEKARRKLKRNLLNHFKFTYEDDKLEFDRFNEFIDDAYDNVEQSAEFKTELLSSQSYSINNILAGYCRKGKFHHAIQFIDALAPSEQVALVMKRLQIYPTLEQMLRECQCTALIQFEEHQFLNFLRDCLGSNKKVARFKRTLNADEIVQTAIVSAMSDQDNLKYNCFLVEFLEWYFVTPQELDEFWSRYADDEVFVLLTTENE